MFYYVFVIKCIIFKFRSYIYPSSILRQSYIEPSSTAGSSKLIADRSQCMLNPRRWSGEPERI